MRGLGISLLMACLLSGCGFFDTLTNGWEHSRAVAGQEHGDQVGRHTGVGFEVADLEQEHRRLEELGVVFTMPPTRQPWGGFMALLVDPDGNAFYLDQVSEAHGQER